MVALTQSTVSKAVKTLEDELGMPLLNRLGHKNELTAAGEIAYRRALVMLAERTDLMAEINDLRGLKRGVLRIGLPPVGCGVLFAAMFATYRSRYPGIDIELTEYGSKGCANAWKRGGRSGGTAAAGGRRLRLSASTQRTSDRSAARQPPTGPPQANRLHRPGGLAVHPVRSGFCPQRQDPQRLRTQRRDPKVTARSGQIDFIVDLVTAGLGVAFLPRMLAHKHQHPGIALIPWTSPTPIGTSPWPGAPAPTCHRQREPGWSWPRNRRIQASRGRFTESVRGCLTSSF